MRRKRENGTHEIFGVELRRVTSIIGRLKRYGLDEWQATCAVDFMMREVLLPLQKGWMTVTQLKETNLDRTRAAALEEARNRNRASVDLGRQVHGAIHQYYRGAQDRRILDRLMAADLELGPGIRGFLEWERLFHVDMIATEKIVFSFNHGYAGTLDLDAGVILPAEDFGADSPVRRMVVDFKTGSHESTVIMQTAAYVVANEEMIGAPMDGAIVVYLGPTGIPKWKLYTRPELEPAFKMFMVVKEFCELEDAWRKKEPDEESSDNGNPPSPPSSAAGTHPATPTFGDSSF